MSQGNTRYYTKNQNDLVLLGANFEKLSEIQIGNYTKEHQVRYKVAQ